MDIEGNRKLQVRTKHCASTNPPLFSELSETTTVGKHGDGTLGNKAGDPDDVEDRV